MHINKFKSRIGLLGILVFLSSCLVNYPLSVVSLFVSFSPVERLWKWPYQISSEESSRTQFPFLQILWGQFHSCANFLTSFWEKWIDKVSEKCCTVQKHDITTAFCWIFQVQKRENCTFDQKVMMLNSISTYKSFKD